MRLRGSAILNIPVNETVLHMNDPVGAFGDIVIVSDEDDRFSRGIETVDEVEDLETSLGIKIAGWFIGENHEGVVDEGTGDGDTLLLTTGELGGAVVEALVETNELSEILATLLKLREVGLLVNEGDLNVFNDRELGDEIVGLENKSKALAADGGKSVIVHFGDVVAAKEILARGGAVEAAEEIEHGGFSGAGWPHDGDIGTLFDLKVDPPESTDLDIAYLKVFVDATDTDDRLRNGRRWWGGRHGSGIFAGGPHSPSCS
jgi:hypothetical protein